MWNSFIDKGKALAEKAASAAADLDKQLDTAVGIPNDAATPGATETGSADADDTLNDAWADDFNVDSPVKTVVEIFPEEIDGKLPAIPIPIHEEVEEATLKEPPAEEHEETQPNDEPEANEEDDEWGENNLKFEQIETVSTEDVSEEAPTMEPESVAAADNSSRLPESEESPSSDELQTAAGTSLVPEDVKAEESLEELKPGEEALAPASESDVVEDMEEPVLPVEPPVPEDTAPTIPLVVEEVQTPPVLEREEIQANGWAQETILDIEHCDDIPSPVVESESQTQNHIQTQASPELVEAATNELPFTIYMPYDSPTKPTPMASNLQEANRGLQEQLEALQRQLQQREDQLVSKTEQMSTIQSMHESEKHELQTRIHDTKEEAKKRIQKAKDRVETMDARLRHLSSSKSSEAGDAAQQVELIAALRAEGENLARKQSEMEKAVRSAKGETRELRLHLEEEISAKETALGKISKLETDLKSTRDNLASARRGESQAGKLDSELQHAREDSEGKSARIVTLEQEVKELTAENKELKIELAASRKGAAVENERDQKKWRKEHNEAIEDLETKLRAGEREAGIREDALRREVEELRKRWQDAVRRADSLSMDSQSSTAPLLRQLESVHRQNRARASAWAELETKLRSELEENVIANEKLSRERNDWKTKHNRLERTAKEHEDALKATKNNLEEKTVRVQQLEQKLADIEAEGAKMKEEWAEVERLANEGVSRVRSEMTMSVVESGERHRSQLDSIEAELRQEREKRTQLERQVEELVTNAGMIVPPSVMRQQDEQLVKPKKLRQSEGQAQILAGALNGLGGEDSNSDDEDSASDAEAFDTRDAPRSNGAGSFAALEELTSRLKAARVELNTLRKTLVDSEESRKELAEELGETRNAKEKLPLFETKVSELTVENQQQAMEMQALQEDIVEVREMYRTQLNLLLEEKAAIEAALPATNGTGTDAVSVEESTETEEAEVS
jgi:chromosome segregation ATPase